METIPVRQIVSVQTQEINAGRFSIRPVQQILNGKGLVHDLHKHDFYFCLLIEKGAGLHEIDFKAYPIHDYSIFILRPGQVHRLELLEGSTGFLMEFDLSFYQPKKTISSQRWQKAASKNYCAIETDRYRKLQSLLTNVFNEFSTRQDGYAEAIKANLDIFFIEYTRQSQNPDSITKVESNYIQERYEEFVHLLEINIGRMKNVAQYAELLNLSPYQLNSITKTSVGKTVSEMINEQILLEAKRYLLATPAQIKELADHLGYEDVSYFIRFFKKQTGYSPEAFRKNFK